MLRRMDKSARVERSERAVNWAAEVDIKGKGAVHARLPRRNAGDDRNDQGVRPSHPDDGMNLTKFTPYPGSPVYRELYGTTIREDHWEKMNGINFVWAPDGMSVEELDRRYQEMMNWFYRQKRVRRRYVKESIRNPGPVVRLARAGLGFGMAKARSYLEGVEGCWSTRMRRTLM